MKRYLGAILRQLLTVYQNVNKGRIKNEKVLYVLDIDNTLTINELNSPINHKNPVPNKSMVDYVRNLKSEKNTIIFLSARSYKLLFPTYNWLKKQSIIDTRNQLFLVPNAKTKIAYLTQLIDQKNTIIYIDDLSFNHENGEVKYYDDVIDKVQKLNIEYKGVDFINQIFKSGHLS